MIQISALNDSSSDESDVETQFEGTKEAQESNGFALYNKALGLQRAGNHCDAERVYHQLLNTWLLTHAEPPDDPEKPGGLVQPGIILKYSTYKNLGSIAFQRHDLHIAMENYLEAATLDSTDVTLWYKIGTVAVDLLHLPLARVAFQQGLTCNQKHWPCLDQLCTVLYALNDYASLAFRDQIFSEQSSLRKDSYHMFRHCHDSIHNARVGKEEANKIIQEALTLREKKRALQKKPDSPVLKFLTPLKKYTWKDIGDQLIALYDHISDRIPKLSIGCTIDLSASLQMSCEEQTDTSMDIDQPTALPTQEAVSPVATGGNNTTTESTTERSSNQTDAANPSGQSQDQMLGIEDGQDARHEMEKRQENTGMSRHIDDVCELEGQEAEVQDVQFGEQDKSTTGPPPFGFLECDTTTQATTDPPLPMETETGSVGNKKKHRAPKRKRERIDVDEAYGGKRRSARVRNTTKKKEETVSVNYAELLQRFLPSSLTDSEVDDEITNQDGTTGTTDETLTQNAPPMQDTSGKYCENDISAFTSTEEEDVKQFLKDHEDNSGILDLLHYYLVSLAKRYNLRWPSNLTCVYVKAFERLRNHCCFPEVLSSDASQQYRYGVGEMLLVYAELKLDQWLVERAKISSHSSPKKASSTGRPASPADFPGQFFEEDIGYVQDMAYLPCIVGEAWRIFAIRVNWMKSRFLILQGNSEMSIDFFDECTYLLTSGKAENDPDHIPMTVVLPNCIQDNVISKNQVDHQKKSLERCQSLEEVQRLYRAEDYKRVVQLLLPTVLQPSMATRGKSMTETTGSGTVPERMAQLELLHNTLLKLADYEQCIVCGSASLAETWQELLAAKTGVARVDWTGLLIQILEVLDRSLLEGISVLKSVERSRLVQLTSTLISIIEHAMEGAETESMQPITTVLPWIVLYRLIKLQEDKLTAMRISTGSPRRSSSPVPMMLSSLMLLETAHEHLGRHSWCCNSEGALLKLYVSVIQSDLSEYTDDEVHPFQDDMQLALEQCFYCLYAHPNRRSKARHLQDHGVEEIPLVWEESAFMFDTFKPKVVPEFDSYKANSMSADLEGLFLKICKIIPELANSTNTLEIVQAYMEGNSNKAPALPPDTQDDRPVEKEIYYFLADFYFKNKEFGKAIKFYCHDISVCPNRLDSWAGMALARGGRLDLKLNSCDSKTETPIYKHSVSALICFKRALEINSTNLSLWIEYGSLAYTLHSHASRQLKQRVHLHLSNDTAELLRNKQKEMLELSGDCFLKASECEGDGDGEEWLVKYMLGKVAEKKQINAAVYLGHYLEAAQHLYENEAKYPKKITYHNPPDLSLEALEMYFRLHASILKLLEKEDKEGSIDYGLLNEFVLKASETPFVKAKEKQSDISSSEFESDGKSSSGQRSGQSSSTPLSPAYMTPQDHDYLARKSKKRNVSLETISTETASEGEILSGDDTTNSSSSQSTGSVKVARSMTDLQHKDTTTETSTSSGVPTETESSQDESPVMEPRVTLEGYGWDTESGMGGMKPPDTKTSVLPDGEILAKQINWPSQNRNLGTSVPSKVAVPIAITKVTLEDANVTSEDVTGESESEPEIIDISDSPLRQQPKVTKPKVLKPKLKSKVTKPKLTKAKVIKKKSVAKSIAKSKESSEGKQDVSLIDLTVDSSDGESLVSTPPRKSPPESPIKVNQTKSSSPVASSTKVHAAGSGVIQSTAGSSPEALGVKSSTKETLVGADIMKDSSRKSDKPVDGAAMDVDSLKPKESKEDEPMEVEVNKDDKEKTTKQETDKANQDKSSKPAAETSTLCERASLIERCVNALGLCLSRFPQHYKSLYRLAHAYCYLDSLKNLQWSRDVLLGSQLSWHLDAHMPSPGLFGEHSKTKNLFQGIWRIPITEIDRSGSFPWHMYRSVVLVLEVLEHLQDHPTLLQLAIKLSKIPEQGKKYLRDMDRQYLSQQSYQLCLAVLQQQISEAVASDKEDRKLKMLLAACKVWQCVQAGKLQVDATIPGNILKDAYTAYKGSQIESEPSVLEQAVRFCAYYNIANKLPQTPTSQHGDMSFLGRSPKDSWCGSPTRSSQLETRVFLPGSHDNKSSPEVSMATAPKKTVIGGQSHGSSLSGLYSFPNTNFQGAYKESLLLKTREAEQSNVSKAVKRVTCPPTMTSQSHITKVLTQAKATTVLSKPIVKLHTLSSTAKAAQFSASNVALQTKVSIESKAISVTKKPIIKLRTPSSMALQKSKNKQIEVSKVQPAVGQEVPKASDFWKDQQSKHLDTSAVQHLKPSVADKTSHGEIKRYQLGVTGKQFPSSVYADPRLSPAIQHASVSQPSAKSSMPMITASAEVVQRLKEALSSKQLGLTGSPVSKLSAQKAYAKHVEGSIGSQSNRPISTVSKPSGIGQSNRPISTVSKTSNISPSNRPISTVSKPSGVQSNRPISTVSKTSSFSQSSKPMVIVSQASSGVQSNRPVPTVPMPLNVSHSNRPISTVSKPSGLQSNRPISTISKISNISQSSRPMVIVSQASSSAQSNRPVPTVSVPLSISQTNRPISTVSKPSGLQSNRPISTISKISNISQSSRPMVIVSQASSSAQSNRPVPTVSVPLSISQTNRPISTVSKPSGLQSNRPISTISKISNISQSSRPMVIVSQASSSAQSNRPVPTVSVPLSISQTNRPISTVSKPSGLQSNRPISTISKISNISQSSRPMVIVSQASSSAQSNRPVPTVSVPLSISQTNRPISTVSKPSGLQSNRPISTISKISNISQSSRPMGIVSKASSGVQSNRPVPTVSVPLSISQSNRPISTVSKTSSFSQSSRPIVIVSKASSGVQSNRPVPTVSMPLNVSQSNRPISTVSKPSGIQSNRPISTISNISNISQSSRPMVIVSQASSSAQSNRPVPTVSVPLSISQTNRPISTVSKPSGVQSNRPISTILKPSSSKYELPTHGTSRVGGQSNMPLSSQSYYQIKGSAKGPGTKVEGTEVEGTPMSVSKPSSFHRAPAMHGVQASIGSHRPVSATSMTPTGTHTRSESQGGSHSNTPTSSGAVSSSIQDAQQKEQLAKGRAEPKPAESKTAFLSSYLSFLGGSK